MYPNQATEPSFVLFPNATMPPPPQFFVNTGTASSDFMAWPYPVQASFLRASDPSTLATLAQSNSYIHGIVNDEVWQASFNNADENYIFPRLNRIRPGQIAQEQIGTLINQTVTNSSATETAYNLANLVSHADETRLGEIIQQIGGTQRRREWYNNMWDGHLLNLLEQVLPRVNTTYLRGLAQDPISQAINTLSTLPGNQDNTRVRNFNNFAPYSNDSNLDLMIQNTGHMNELQRSPFLLNATQYATGTQTLNFIRNQGVGMSEDFQRGINTAVDNRLSALAIQQEDHNTYTGYAPQNNQQGNHGWGHGY